MYDTITVTRNNGGYLGQLIMTLYPHCIKQKLYNSFPLAFRSVSMLGGWYLGCFTEGHVRYLVFNDYIAIINNSLFQYIEKFRSLSDEIMMLPSIEHYDMIRLDCEDLKRGLSDAAKGLAGILMDRVASDHRAENKRQDFIFQIITCHDQLDINIIIIWIDSNHIHLIEWCSWICFQKMYTVSIFLLNLKVALHFRY